MQKKSLSLYFLPFLFFLSSCTIYNNTQNKLDSKPKETNTSIEIQSIIVDKDKNIFDTLFFTFETKDLSDLAILNPRKDILYRKYEDSEFISNITDIVTLFEYSKDRNEFEKMEEYLGITVPTIYFVDLEPVEISNNTVYVIDIKNPLLENDSVDSSKCVVKFLITDRNSGAIHEVSKAFEVAGSRVIKITE